MHRAMYVIHGKDMMVGGPCPMDMWLLYKIKTCQKMVSRGEEWKGGGREWNVGVWGGMEDGGLRSEGREKGERDRGWEEICAGIKMANGKQ